MHPTEIYNYFLPCGGAILGQDHLLNVSCQPSSSWPGMSTSIQSHFLAKHTTRQQLHRRVRQLKRNDRPRLNSSMPILNDCLVFWREIFKQVSCQRTWEDPAVESQSKVISGSYKKKDVEINKRPHNHV